MKKILLVGLLMFSSAAYGQAKPAEAPKAEVSAPAPLQVQKVDKDTVAPPKEWSDKYQQFVALMQMIQQKRAETGLDKLEQLAQEMQVDLLAKVPAGYKPTSDGQFVKTQEQPKTEKK